MRTSQRKENAAPFIYTKQFMEHQVTFYYLSAPKTGVLGDQACLMAVYRLER